MIERYTSETAPRGGFALGKLLALLVALGVVAGILLGGRHWVGQKKEAKHDLDYWRAEKSDFQVTVKLTGELVSTDVEKIQCGLEGTTTIESIVDEGTDVDKIHKLL